MTGCPFCERIAAQADLVAADRLVVAFHDAFPVSQGHLLVVPRRHVQRLADLDASEWDALMTTARRLAASLSADGVNIGVNDGVAAGQTVAHVHVHLIPRREGDVLDPRGGVRRIFPDRAAYWDTP